MFGHSHITVKLGMFTKNMVKQKIKFQSSEY